MNLTGTLNYEYTLNDHIGNNWLNFDRSGGAVAKQQQDYYPFGLEIARGTTPSPKNEYLYNKKELQEELIQYDYGARFYDPVIGRWTSVDPLAELGRRFSPYNYTLNNPIRFIDPDDMLTDYYDENGAYYKHVEDGSTDKVRVLASGSPEVLDAAIASGQVNINPSNEALAKMDEIFSSAGPNGTTRSESGFVGATDGTTSAVTTQKNEQWKPGSAYDQVYRDGKTPAYSVHNHFNVTDKDGNITKIGDAGPSGFKGGTPKLAGDTEAYGKEGDNKYPSFVLF